MCASLDALISGGEEEEEAGGGAALREGHQPLNPP